MANGGTNTGRRRIDGRRRGRCRRPSMAIAVAVATDLTAAARWRPSRGSASIAGGDLVGECLGPAGERLVPVDREIGEERDLLAAMIDPARHEEDRPVGPGSRGLLVELREDDDFDQA